jgi:hypothetical protein
VVGDVIVKVKKDGKTMYRVVSHQTRKNFGEYRTRAAAQRRLAQIKRFR